MATPPSRPTRNTHPTGLTDVTPAKTDHGPCGPLVATPRGHVMHYVDEGAGEPLLRFWEAPVEPLDPGSWTSIGLRRSIR